MAPSAKKATLVLEDGKRFDGISFGAEVSRAGEAVFQTGMVGYPESLTDPSYTQQLLVLTFPMIGNYGVPPDTKDDHGILSFFESDKIHPAGLIVADLTEDHSHWNSVGSLSAWLKRENVPGITGIDTRALTKHLRAAGCMLGKIIVEGDDDAAIPFVDPNKENLVASVSVSKIQEYNPSGDVHIVVVDVGMKNNQLRCLINRGARVTVVPWDHDFSSAQYDGLFLSNGPGDPTMCKATITNLQKLLTAKDKRPIFGICLGHQLMALASGASTFKMAYGNRGHNQPCTHEETRKCFITSQNHGFAVDTASLSEGWHPLFTNENDQTNEGIVHDTLPYYSVQFHPEASAGPEDLESLFNVFLDYTRAKKQSPSIRGALATHINDMGRAGIDRLKIKEKHPKKVIVLGSGGLSIGQAGEFDYSGSQAIKAMQEEGIFTVLINPNIATVQTMQGLADKVYFLPVTPDYVESVIEHERPDGCLLAFGGQTALNCGIELNERKVFEKYEVEVLGTPVQAIVDTEDREVFGRKLAEIGERVCPNVACSNVQEVLTAAKGIGFPIMMRSSFALGGLGSGVVHNLEELEAKAEIAFKNTTQVMVEPSLQGWKEIEYEVVRDVFDNTITVCNMENFDPLGVHTGESIVIAPSQTLNDDEYNLLRTVACKVVRHIGVIGECNIQYAVNPNSRDYFIIEVNARLSRSSALASKATGYPLAYVAAKLALNKSLPALRNSVTKKTTACFEPSLDYCVVKIPRWDLGKFPNVDRKLGTSMKSVGEVMAIGRSFEEAFQKALRMVDIGVEGFDPGEKSSDELLSMPSEQRPLIMATALAEGVSVDRMYELTKIDRWFLYRLKSIIEHGKTLAKFTAMDIPRETLLRAKQLGFSDKQIAKSINSNQLAVRKVRKGFGLRPIVKQIDTVAAEYPAFTNYLYLTYNGTEDDVEFTGGYTMVLGSGVYRIGSSVEFDYCCVGCVRELRKLGHKTILINYNPETVSTDYDECDRLYFDQLTFETVLDVYELENARGVVVSMGGQIPNNMAAALDRQNVRIFGTAASQIDGAENRYKFSRMCDTNGIDQPRWKALSSIPDAMSFCEEVTYPVLIRPSFVLSGTAMRVAHSASDLEQDLKDAAVVNRDYPVVISKFIADAKEIEIDAVASKGKMIAFAISEHVENAGVHSGDATIVHPAQDLTDATMVKVEAIARRVAKALDISGPFNIQFIAKDDQLKVIECNVRVSRSFPFVSKTTNIDLIAIATRVMIGEPPQVPAVKILEHVGVKVPQFSFNRLAGADPTLGVDMISTGEVACFGKTREEAYVKAMLSTSFTLPKKNILLSIGSFKDKKEFLNSARTLAQLGYVLFGSLGTADFYQEHDVPITPVTWMQDTEEMTITDQLCDGTFHLVINLPMRNKYRRPASYTTAGRVARRMAVDYRVPLITNIKCAKVFVEALRTCDLAPHVSTVDSQSSSQWIRLPALLLTCAPLKLAPTAEGDSSWADASRDMLRAGFAGTCVASPASTDAEWFRGMTNTMAGTASCDYSLLQTVDSPDETVLPTSAGLAFDLRGPDGDRSAELLRACFSGSSRQVPICVAATGHELASAMFFSSLYNRPVHIYGVAHKADIELIREAKAKDVRVTCSINPLHLFPLGPKFQHVQPADWLVHMDALWANLDTIDAFCGDDFNLPTEPSMEKLPSCLAIMPLLLTAMDEGKLQQQDIEDRLVHNVAKIFGLRQPSITESYIEFEIGRQYDLVATEGHLFTGSSVVGRVSRVVLHQEMVFVDGRVVCPPGSGKLLQASGVIARVSPKQLVMPSSPTRPVSTQPSGAGFITPPPPSPSKSMLKSKAKAFEFKPVAEPVAEFGFEAEMKRMPHSLSGTDVITVKKMTKQDMYAIFYYAQKLKLHTPIDLLRGKVMASIFYEPSTRTACSFSAAMERLGGSVVPVHEVRSSSVSKGESLSDFIRCMECYTDITVLRHPVKNSVAEAAAVAKNPLLNAGDGTGEHPTQALLDVFTIREELGTANNLNITMVGDLKHGRTVHSLARLLSLYKVSIRYVSAKSLAMPKDIIEELNAKNIPQSEHTSLEGLIKDTDVLYVTRIQRERFETEAEYEAVKGSFRITMQTLAQAKDKMIVMHPLPRVDEISTEVDTDPRAAYFRQMKYGMYVRMALLGMCLGRL